MKLNKHEFEIILLALSYLQLHLQKQYEEEEDITKKYKIYYKHVDISRLSNKITNQFMR